MFFTWLKVGIIKKASFCRYYGISDIFSHIQTFGITSGLA